MKNASVLGGDKPCNENQRQTIRPLTVSLSGCSTSEMTSVTYSLLQRTVAVGVMLGERKSRLGLIEDVGCLARCLGMFSDQYPSQVGSDVGCPIKSVLVLA